MLFLLLQVAHGFLQLSWTHGSCRVLLCPPQSENVSWLPTRCVTASSLEELDEPGQVDSCRRTNHHVYVCLQDREADDLGFVSRRRLSEELVEKLASCLVDHRPAIERGPDEMEVELVSGHEARCRPLCCIHTLKGVLGRR